VGHGLDDWYWLRSVADRHTFVVALHTVEFCSSEAMMACWGCLVQ
jgi:hypothetical protein